MTWTMVVSHRAGKMSDSRQDLLWIVGGYRGKRGIKNVLYVSARAIGYMFLHSDIEMGNSQKEQIWGSGEI